MQTLTTDLRNVIARHLEQASPRDILAIASALCAEQQTSTLEVLEAGDAAQSSRFQIIDEDLVTDRSTGLMWTRLNVSSDRMSWSAAQDACASLHLGGYADWRLPTIRELVTLVDYERHNPAIDTSVFTCESSWYWTSTPYAPSPGVCAWFVYFVDGYALWVSHDGNGFVRAVRAGQ